MALTKVTGSVIKDSVSLSGNVSIGGTLTYQDVTNVDSVGIVTARNGVDASGTSIFRGPLQAQDNLEMAGELVHLSDNDTRIRFPANDTISFQTAGSERLRIDSLGRLGLGTNDPSSFNSYARNLVIAQSSGDAGITISAQDAGSEYGSLHFSGGTTVRSYIDQQNGTTGRMFFMNKANGYMGFGTNNTERLRIKSNGNVGINQSSPTAKLEIVDSAYHQLYLKGSGTVGGIRLGNSGNQNGFIYYDNGPNLLFNVNNSEKVRITSSGNLLIGTVTPGYADLDDLTISTSGNTGITIRSGTSSLGVIGFADGTSGNAQYRGVIQYSHSGDYMQFNTADAERLRIDSNGTAILKNTGAATSRSDFFGSLRPISQIASTWNAYHSLTRHDAGSSYGPYLMLAKNRNDLYNSNGTVQDNDECGNIAFLGNDGTAFREASRIRGEVDGTPGSSQVPGALTFATNAGSGVVERLRISAQGYVTSPNQPSFNVTITTVGQINSNVGVVIFNNTNALGNHNNGNHYNTSNGRFTAPVAGRYQFNARMLTNSSTTAYTIYLLRVNANHVGYIGHNHSDYWLMESGSFVLNLQANDYVDCYIQQHSGHGGHNYASFSGFLIG